MQAFIANHLWQSTLFAVAAGLLTLALRQNHAHARHWLWMIASLKFLVPFAAVAVIGSYFTPSVAPPVAVANAVTAVESLSQPFAAPREAPEPSSHTAFPIAELLCGIWACGFLAIGASWTSRWMRIRKSVRAASPLPIDIGVPVRASRGLFEPGIFGVFRPVLLLPEGIAQRLDAAQLHAILAHELCHVRRRDNLAAAIHMVVEATFWFHPLVWWIGARLVEERERACDEDVLRLGNDPEIYAESILRACRFYLESPMACVSGVTGGGLKHRIEQIMTQRIGVRLDFARKLLLAGAGIVAVATPIAIGLVHTPVARAQTQSPSFEVASIKPSKPASTGSSVLFDLSGRLNVENASLKRLIRSAYQIEDFQVAGGPVWLDADTFDITAKPERKPAPNEGWLMLQKLLADRFQLKFHRESREMPLYELSVGRNGTKLHEAASPRHGIAGRPNAIESNGADMAALADTLARKLHRTVVDKTGLTGLYDYKLEFSLDSATDGTALPSIFTGLQEQLGLRLESAKGPVEILVIDHAEKPSEN